jgi:hypothetical protein
MMLVRRQHHALVLGADKPNKASGPVVDDKYCLHVAAGRSSFILATFPMPRSWEYNTLFSVSLPFLGRAKLDSPDRSDLRANLGVCW